MKSFLIIIPHYVSDELLARVLVSVGAEVPREALSRGDTQVVVPFSEGEIFIANNNPLNRGFTAGCNEGIRYALSHGFSYVWLLNNDTQVVDLGAAVDVFKKEFKDNPSTGVVGCQIRSLENPDFIHHAGTLAVMPGGIHKTGYVSQGDYTKRTRERWVTGASLVISARALQEIGVLDERFFNYASDSDFCYRVRAAGMNVVYLPVPILHAIGQSAQPSPEQQKILEQDVWYFYAKWITGELFKRLDGEL